MSATGRAYGAFSDLTERQMCAMSAQVADVCCLQSINEARARGAYEFSFSLNEFQDTSSLST
jgi:hypothetical protein